MGSLWNRSGMVERYADDIRAAGAKAFFYAGGTTTPMTVFRDSGEGSAHPNPVVADANGRWPDVFVPYVVSFDVQVKTADDVQLTYSLQIPNPNPVDQTVIVDPTEVVQTGMIHAELVNSTKAGYVRLNGRTLGNAASGGTERANADTVDLFTYLWNSLTNAIAPVSAGRGATAAADYAANKNITLPSMQGTVMVGLDDMGNAAAGAFAGLVFSAGDAVTAGSATGGNTYTLSVAQMPAHTHAGTTASNGAHTHGAATGIQSADHTHSGTTNGHTHTGGATNSTGDHAHLTSGTANIAGLNTGVGGGVGFTAGSFQQVFLNTVTTSTNGAHSHTVTMNSATDTFTSGVQSANHTHTISSDGAHTHTFTTDSTGGATAVNNLPLARLVTWFIKL